MRIAIVDDIAPERKQLIDRLSVQLNRYSVDSEILEYENGEAFLSDAEKEHFALVFMDIYMDGKSGVEIAKKLRSFDRDCLLVFTTCSTDHALDGFQVRALHYLVKPYSDNELNTIFNEIMERLPSPDKYLDIHIVGGCVRLRLGEILYAEHFKHRIHIHTADGQTTITRQTFSDFIARLDGDERFFLCSRGVIINFEYAQDFDGAAFTLSSGCIISVSRNRAKAARAAFGDFLFKRGRKQ